jgi:hypothetical protein
VINQDVNAAANLATLGSLEPEAVTVA